MGLYGSVEQLHERTEKSELVGIQIFHNRGEDQPNQRYNLSRPNGTSDFFCTNHNKLPGPGRFQLYWAKQWCRYSCGVELYWNNFYTQCPEYQCEYRLPLQS